MRTHSKIASMVAAVLLWSNAAAADTITFTNLSDWQAVVTGYTTITFEENNTGAFTQYPGSTVFNGVTFTSDAALATVDQAYDPYYNGIGTGDVLSVYNGSALTASGFASTALAFNFAAVSQVSIELSTGESFTRASSLYTSQFFGVTSTTPITRVTLGYPAESVVMNIDNFAFTGSAAAVPEPASLTLLGFGLAVLGARRCWRQARSARGPAVSEGCRRAAIRPF
jgi:hypothetical protein